MKEFCFNRTLIVFIMFFFTFSLVVYALMVMKFGAGIKLNVFYTMIAKSL